MADTLRERMLAEHRTIHVVRSEESKESEDKKEKKQKKEE